MDLWPGADASSSEDCGHYLFADAARGNPDKRSVNREEPKPNFPIIAGVALGLTGIIADLR